MSQLAIEGFDGVATLAELVATRGWTSLLAGTGAEVQIDTTGGRRGGGAFKINDTDSANRGCIKKRMRPDGTLSAQASCIVGWALKWSNTLVTGTVGNLCAILNADGEVMCGARLRFVTSNWVLEFYTGSTVRATYTLGPTVPAAGIWHYFELKVPGFNTAAANPVTIGWNGNYYTSGNVVTCDSLASPVTMTEIIFMGIASSLGFSYSDNNTVWADDFYWGTTAGTGFSDLLGDCRVDTLYPNGDGNSDQFTPLTGTDAYAMLDETSGHDGDTSYVYSNTASHKTDLTFQDIPFNPSPDTIFGMQLNVVAKREATGARTIRTYMRESGADTESASTYDLALTTTYAGIWAVFAGYSSGLGRHRNKSEVDALNFGFKNQV